MQCILIHFPKVHAMYCITVKNSEYFHELLLCCHVLQLPSRYTREQQWDREAAHMSSGLKCSSFHSKTNSARKENSFIYKKYRYTYKNKTLYMYNIVRLITDIKESDKQNKRV